MFQHIVRLVNDHQFNVVDGGATGLWLFALLQWVPHISAVLSLIWIVLRLWVTIRDDFVNKKDKDGNK